MEDIGAIAGGLIQEAEQETEAFLAFLAQPWTLIQLAIIAGCVLLAWAAQRALEPPLEARVRTIRGRPRLLRFLAFFLRRIRWVVLPLLLWGAVILLRAVTWPSRSYLVGLTATLALAWLVVAFASRIIRTPAIARLVAILVWTTVALLVLGLLDEVRQALDAAGFTFGELRVSLLGVIEGVALFAALLWLAKLSGDFVQVRLERTSDLTPSLQVLIGKLVKIALVIVAILVPVRAMGIDLTALALFSSAVGVGIGFGLQKVVSNFISGVIILMDKSIKPGDVITLGDTFGWIRSLRARFVSVVTRDGQEYLIPNEDFITQQVVNWSFTDRLVRIEVEFGVSYDSDPHQVRKLAAEAARGVARVQVSPPPVCHLVGFGESSLEFKLRFWIADPQEGLWNVRGLVLLACWDAFKANGVSIPFPHREIIMRTPVKVEVDEGSGMAEAD